MQEARERDSKREGKMRVNAMKTTYFWFPIQSSDKQNSKCYAYLTSTSTKASNTNAIILFALSSYSPYGWGLYLIYSTKANNNMLIVYGPHTWNSNEYSQIQRQCIRIRKLFAYAVLSLHLSTFSFYGSLNIHTNKCRYIRVFPICCSLTVMLSRFVLLEVRVIYVLCTFTVLVVALNPKIWNGIKITKIYSTHIARCRRRQRQRMEKTKRSKKSNMARIKPVVTLSKFSRSSCTSCIGSVKFSLEKVVNFCFRSSSYLFSISYFYICRY